MRAWIKDMGIGLIIAWSLTIVMIIGMFWLLSVPNHYADYNTALLLSAGR